MLIKVENGQVVKSHYSIGDLRRDNPNTSFPKNIPESTLNSYGVYTVSQSSLPSYNENSETVTSSVQNVDGAWVRTWTVSQLPDADAAINNRRHRDSLIAETDFYALSDVTMSAEMTTYRQALRDITTHANWPHLNDDDWPTKP